MNSWCWKEEKITIGLAVVRAQIHTRAPLPKCSIVIIAFIQAWVGSIVSGMLTVLAPYYIDFTKNGVRFPTFELYTKLQYTTVATACQMLQMCAGTVAYVNL